MASGLRLPGAWEWASSSRDDDKAGKAVVNDCGYHAETFRNPGLREIAFVLGRVALRKKLRPIQLPVLRAN